MGTRGAHGDRAFVDALLRPEAKAATTGVLTWTRGRGQRHEGRVRVVAAALPHARDAELLVTINRQRVEQLWLVYLADGANVRRLCVNHEHRPYAGTHKHKAECLPPDDCYEPDDIPAVPVSPDVGPELYREVFEAFAAECHVVLGDDFEWSPPWEV